jgi:hypothetical protein
VAQVHDPGDDPLDRREELEEVHPYYSLTFNKLGPDRRHRQED